jgi:hypothetical protein
MCSGRVSRFRSTLRLITTNRWFSRLHVSSILLSGKSWKAPQALECRINGEIYTPYAVFIGFNISALSWRPGLVVEEAGVPERIIDHGKATGNLYHLRLRVECTLFCFFLYICLTDDCCLKFTFPTQCIFVGIYMIPLSSGSGWLIGIGSWIT